jgi:AraC-like DNA-binding protein
MLLPPDAAPPGALVRTIWASAGHGTAGRERVLPTGDVHLVLRLEDRPLRLFDGVDDPAGRTVSTAVVGGARAAAYVRAVEPGCPSVGVVLAPGACRALTGVPAGALAGRHVALEDLWPAGRVAEMRARLAGVALPDRPAVMARLLSELSAGEVRRDEAVLAGLRALRLGAGVAAAAGAAGLSRRQFGRRFMEEVGLSPRDWLGVRRFNRLLVRLHAGAEPLAESAVAAGFADQPHMSRAFADIAGLTPGAYRALPPVDPRHVPVAQSFKTGAGPAAQGLPAKREGS